MPPLFIPVWFFEFNLKPRNGYKNKIDGWINVNSNKINISSDIDLCCLLEDLLYFGADRISIIDINPAFKLKVSREDSNYYKNTLNPFYTRKKKKHSTLNIRLAQSGFTFKKLFF